MPASFRASLSNTPLTSTRIFAAFPSPYKLESPETPKFLNTSWETAAITQSAPTISSRGGKTHAILSKGFGFVGPRIHHKRLNAIRSKLFYDIDNFAITCIWTVLLKRETQNNDLCFSRRQPSFNKLFYCGVSYIRAHSVVDNTTIENDLAVIAKLFCFVSEVIRIHANAMPSHKARTKTQ